MPTQYPWTEWKVQWKKFVKGCLVLSSRSKSTKFPKPSRGEFQAFNDAKRTDYSAQGPFG